jgi:hypothetical protein
MVVPACSRDAAAGATRDRAEEDVGEMLTRDEDDEKEDEDGARKKDGARPSGCCFG